jgi:hypothetical protein
LSLALRNVGINFNGRRRLNAIINAQGIATFKWDMDITSNGLTYEPDSPFQASIGLNILSPSVSIVIPRGRLKANYSGWPANGYIFPAQAITVSTNQSSISRTFYRIARSWQTVPGFPFAEYRLTAPKIKVSLQGTNFTSTLSGGVRVRTKARRPDNQRWADVNATFSSSINSQGVVQLEMPSWGNIGDPLQTGRADCNKKARNNNPLPDKPPDVFSRIKPQKPNYPRPNWYDPVWLAYDIANAAYIAAKKSWEDSWKAFNDAVKALNAALDQCDQEYPQPPLLEPLGVIYVGLKDILN